MDGGESETQKLMVKHQLEPLDMRKNQFGSPEKFEKDDVKGYVGDWRQAMERDHVWRAMLPMLLAADENSYAQKLETGSKIASLCSVVPCSISSQNASSLLAHNKDRENDAQNCFSTKLGHRMENFQSLNLSVLLVQIMSKIWTPLLSVIRSPVADHDEPAKMGLISNFSV
ncbi:hypothetical protein GH714_036711 [Hevea brasiliensis]|uniref:Uncharacterized protein n=1 Tax=Hevea brasiliensis TaxID=3981 RepID=A0A6A6NEZ3_HEVBR|nr:hypothetical protein GH714_036711 [Hevea brasiliensis]